MGRKREPRRLPFVVSLAREERLPVAVLVRFVPFCITGEPLDPDAPIVTALVIVPQSLYVLPAVQVTDARAVVPCVPSIPQLILPPD